MCSRPVPGMYPAFPRHLLGILFAYLRHVPGKSPGNLLLIIGQSPAYPNPRHIPGTSRYIPTVVLENIKISLGYPQLFPRFVEWFRVNKC